MHTSHQQTEGSISQFFMIHLLFDMYDSVFTDSSIGCAMMEVFQTHRDHMQVTVALAGIAVRILFNWGAVWWQ